MVQCLAMAGLEKLLQIADYFIDCVTFVDVQAKGRPCIYASRNFEEQTGYTRDEVIGKNLRLLQGPLTRMETVEFMRECFEKKVACVQDIINYRKDGTPFLNRLLLLPLASFSDENSFIYAGFQNDVTQKYGLEYNNKILQKISNEEIQHVMNNKLTIVLGKLGRKLSSTSDANEIKVIQDELNHIFKQINDFSVDIEKLSEFEEYEVFRVKKG